MKNEEVINTRLRFVCSKDPMVVAAYPNKLGYKVEIKGGPSYCPKDKKWYLWFVIPDVIQGTLEAISGDLD